MKKSCGTCRKCGENICGNDYKDLSCYEPLIISNKETIKTIKRHLKGIEKAVNKLEREE